MEGVGARPPGDPQPAMMHACLQVYLTLVTHCLQEAKLLNMNVYKKVYKTIANRLAEKGQRGSIHKDAQDGTIEDAPPPEQYLELVKHLMQEGEHDGNAVRDLSMFLFQTMSVGR